METRETHHVAMKDISNYHLKAHNTFGLDVECRRFVEVATVEELQAFVRTLSAADEPLLVVGRGSNMLFTKDFPGTVLHSAIMGCQAREEGDEVYLTCGSGETWDHVVAMCVERGWYGMENLSLIPGEVGASAVQNIGAYGSEVAELIVEVEAVSLEDGRCVSFKNADCHYGYRESRFKREWKGKFVVTHVTYRLHKTFSPNIHYGNLTSVLAQKGIENPTAAELRQAVIETRQAKLPDPEVVGNAGSFFVNPTVPLQKYEALIAAYPNMPHYQVAEDRVKIPAGWMIEQCGWKGRKLGNAGVYEKQALVLVNCGGATGEEIVALCEAIRKSVFERFGIDIHPEVNII